MVVKVGVLDRSEGPAMKKEGFATAGKPGRANPLYFYGVAEGAASSAVPSSSS